MTWWQYLILFAVSCVVAMLVVPLAKMLAKRLDAIDYPSERRVNKRPIPRLGGVAILTGIVAALLVLFACTELFGWRSSFLPGIMRINYFGAALSVIAIFAVGFIDDVVSLGPKAKLLGQIVAATIAAASGILLSSIHNPFGPGFIEFGWLAYPITIFYLVAFANIINLIDGLDGLAAGISGICALTIFALSVMTARLDAAILSIAIAGACFGFLRYNFNPASIFMGDSGALLLGFSLGAVSLMAIARSALFVSLLVPVIAAGIPVIDTFFAIVRRLSAHRPIDSADKGHIHHKLLQAGFSQRKTVLIMYLWTLVLAICSIAIAEASGIIRIVAVVIAIVLTIYMILKLRLLDPVLAHHYNPREKRPEHPDAEASPKDETNAS